MTEAAESARERFVDALDRGQEVNELAFTGWLAGFSRSDRAWLRKEVRAGRIAEIPFTYPFGRRAYARPAAA